MILLFALMFLVIILLFSSKRFSPVPYFPTSKKDLPLAIIALSLKNNQTVIDLGAGDGLVLFEAAKEAYKRKLNTQFIAVELNPILILILQLRRFFHPNKQHIKIMWADMFKINLSQDTTIQNPTVYLYISPWLMEQIYAKLKKDLKYFNLISYYYPLPKVKPNKTITGKNKLYTYKVNK